MNLTAKQMIKNPVDNTNYRYPVKEYVVPAADGPMGTVNVPVQPVYLVDPQSNPVTAAGTIAGVDTNTGLPVRISSAPGAPTAVFNNNQEMLLATSLQYLANIPGFYNEALRTPTTFKHALCTTVAATAVWTPAGGKKFRLMGYVICPDAGMAAAGIQLITLLDGAAAITIAHQTYLPIAASITHQTPIVVALPGNGYKSSTADNVLNVTLTTAVTAGAISIFVYGTEE